MTKLIQPELIRPSLIDMAIEAADGGVDALDAYARLRKLRDDVEECMELCKEAALRELEKYGKEAVTKHGYRIVQQNVPMQYGYGPEISELDKELKAKKEIARMALRTGGPMVYPATSEVINPASIIGGGGTTINMTRVKS